MVSSAIPTLTTVRSQAGVVILAVNGPSAKRHREVLLARRPMQSGDPWSGTWCLPGGRSTSVDTSLQEAAQREFFEECGYDLSHLEPMARLGPHLAGCPGAHVEVIAYVFGLDRRPILRLERQEVAAVHWLQLADFRKPWKHSRGPIPGSSLDRIIPYYDLPCTPLWGFTYRLLCSWQELSVSKI